jgi:heat shock protein HslJ
MKYKLAYTDKKLILRGNSMQRSISVLLTTLLLSTAILPAAVNAHTTETLPTSFNPYVTDQSFTTGTIMAQDGGQSDVKGNLEGQWILKSGIEGQPVSDTKFTAKFKDGKILGAGDNNRYGASYTVEPIDRTSGKIQIKITMLSRAGSSEQEQEYIQALKQVSEYRLTDEGLTLTYSSPSRYLLFTQQ